MGIKCAWAAVRDQSVGEVLAGLELGVTGERSEEPSPGLWAIETLDDWVVVVGFGDDCCGDVEESHARQLSFDSWALFFSTAGPDAGATLVEYRDGERTWSLACDNDELAIAGVLPEAIAERLDDLREREQAGEPVDHRKFVLQVGQLLTGFCPDGSAVKAADDEPFLELEVR
jgi:hypothetical protein